MLIFMFLMQFINEGGLMYMIQLIRALQMVLHLPMLRIIMPANSLILISVMIEVAMFDILPSDYTTDLIFEYAEKEDDQKIFGQMKDIGYESSSSLKNLGSLSIFTFLYFLKLAILLVMKIFMTLTPLGESKSINKLYNGMCKSAFYS